MLPGFVVPGRYKESDDDLLSQASCLLSLARERFTVLFGMGRGGSTLLWSSDKGVRNESCGLIPAFELSGVLIVLRRSADCLCHAGFSPACLEEGWVVTVSHTHAALYSATD